MAFNLIFILFNDYRSLYINIYFKTKAIFTPVRSSVHLENVIFIHFNIVSLAIFCQTLLLQASMTKPF